MTAEQTERQSDIGALRDVIAATAEILTSPPRRAAAVTYLRQRSIDPTALPDWPLGHAPPGWTRLVDTLHGTFSEQALLDSGVAFRSSRGSLIDAFRDRVIFPIHDQHGNVAGFVGRDLSGDADAPKYLNSRQSPLFAKSQLLYGLTEGLAATHNEHNAVVLEGPVDVLAVAARARTTGRPELLPVAACGTAFTANHARRLADIPREDPAAVVIAMDGDAAGRTAALQAGEQVRAAGLDARLAVLPNGLDPADYLAQPESILDTFTTSHAFPLLNMQVQHAISVQGDRMQWIEGRLAAARTIAANLATYPVTHAARQIGWIAHALDLGAATFTFELTAAYRTASNAAQSIGPIPTGHREPISI